jgi:hypothetical protein
MKTNLAIYLASILTTLSYSKDAYPKGICPPMIRTVELDVEINRSGEDGGTLVDYPRFDTTTGKIQHGASETTMGYFWKDSILERVTIKNIKSTDDDAHFEIVKIYNTDKANEYENIHFGKGNKSELHHKLLKPINFDKSGLSVIFTGSYITSKGLDLHIDVSKWFCKVPL